MDPFDVMRMAKLIGIDLAVLTDHNSSKNCPAAEIAAKECGIGFIPGVEVTTSEEIHCICLFPSVKLAMKFSESYNRLRPLIRNRADLFGNQLIVHADGTIEEEPYMLYPAASVSIMELQFFVRMYDGLCWPAHVDRGGNSLLAILGGWPEDLRADAVEIKYRDTGDIPTSVKRVNGSDGHRFCDMQEDGYPLPLESADFEGLARYLRGAG